MKPTTFNFNKELFFGECGAFIFANLTTLTVSHFTKNNQVISLSAVAATLFGGALFWLLMRIYDRTREVSFKTRELTNDISYFTPAAIVLGTVVYDPVLYFVSQYLLKGMHAVEVSVLVGQVSAFLLFLLAMNLYRIILMKFKLKDL